jgi:hypothetical protein
MVVRNGRMRPCCQRIHRHYRHGVVFRQQAPPTLAIRAVDQHLHSSLQRSAQDFRRTSPSRRDQSHQVDELARSSNLAKLYSPRRCQPRSLGSSRITVERQRPTYLVPGCPYYPPDTVHGALHSADRVVYDCVKVEPNLIAEIPRSNYFDPPLGYSAGQSMAGTIPWEMWSYIDQGLFETNQHQLDFSCPSGNCTFSGTYSSLAFCSVCEDVSSKLVRVPWPKGYNVTTVPANITLPGLGLGLGFTDLTLEPLTTVGSLEDQRRALAAQGWPSIAAIRMIDDETYVAHSCNISACMQTYKAQVKHNILDETVVSEYVLPLSPE